MQKVKTAVVGVGGLGRHHLKWLSQIPSSELVGLYDIDREKSEKYAAEYGVAAFGSLDEVAHSAQAVSVVVPTTSHFEVASFLIDRRVNCLIEKPVAASLDEAKKLRGLCVARDVKVAVGQIERFNPAVQALAYFHIRPSFIEERNQCQTQLSSALTAIWPEFCGLICPMGTVFGHL